MYACPIRWKGMMTQGFLEGVARKLALSSEVSNPCSKVFLYVAIFHTRNPSKHNPEKEKDG